jgi:hypothetical protein
MALGLSSLSSAQSTIGTLSGILAVSPQQTTGYQPNPISAAGTAITPLPPTILFHYEGEQTTTFESDITDNYVEDNTAIQDQISLKPILVTTHGFIGELNNVPPAALAPYLNQVASKLTLLSAYAPSLTATALLAYNTAFQAYQTGTSAVASATSAWATLNSQNGENVIGGTGLQSGSFNAASGKISNSQNLQQTIFQQFYGYYSQRTLFTVQTPWAVFQNMAILSLKAIQDETTNVVTDFQVTFKMIRFAQTAYALGAQAQGRAFLSSQPATNLGTLSSVPSTNTFGSALSDFGTAPQPTL